MEKRGNVRQLCMSCFGANEWAYYTCKFGQWHYSRTLRTFPIPNVSFLFLSSSWSNSPESEMTKKLQLFIVYIMRPVHHSQKRKNLSRYLVYAKNTTSPDQSSLRFHFWLYDWVSEWTKRNKSWLVFIQAFPLLPYMYVFLKLHSYSSCVSVEKTR